MRGDRYDEHRYQSRDKRSQTHTTYYEYDVDDLQVSQRRKDELKRMLKRQEGEDPGEAYSQKYEQREQSNRREWKRRVVTTYAAHLDLTRHQKERALHLVMDVISINSFAHYATEEVVLAVINRVAREDGRWIEDEQQFRDLAEDCGFDAAEVPERMKALRRMLRERIPSAEKVDRV